MTTALRRTILLVLLALVGGIAITWWRDRSAVPAPAAPPEWPPLPTRNAATNDAVIHEAATDAAGTASAGTPTGWRPPTDGGACPDGFPIKVKVSSGIYHVPGGRFYDRTRADRCYATESAAEADGYRRSKS